MRNILLFLALIGAAFFGQANADPVGSPATLGGTVSSFNGLQFAVAQGGIGSPAGTMSGYVAGDNITLSCPGVTFSVSPIVGVNAISGGSVTASAVIVPGITSGVVPSGSVTCSQASTSGVGSGYQVSVTFGVIAAYLSVPSLTTGGAASNGNLYLNYAAGETFLGAGAENAYFGNKAGYGLLGLSGFNSVLGHNACGNGGTGDIGGGRNTCLGNDAGRNIQGTGLISNTIVGAGAGRNVANSWNVFLGDGAAGSNASNTPGNLTAYNSVVIGYTAGNVLGSGSGDVLIGAKAGSSLTNGSNDVIIAATSGGDNCSNGSGENNVVAFCAGGGRLLTVTGGGTPATSATVIAGSTASSAFISQNTKFTTTGCSVSSTTGGATVGKFTLGANNCSVVVVMNGATGQTAPNGWSCHAEDRTAPLIGISQTADSTTTATLSIPATAGATDVVSFSCMGY